MRLKERHKRDLKKAIEELTAEYNQAIENDYVFKPMAYTLYHLWQNGMPKNIQEYQIQGVIE